MLTVLLAFSLLLRTLIQYRLRDGLTKFNQENPGGRINAGWRGRPLANPTYKLLYGHSVNCHFERDNAWEYSFEWPSVETKMRVGSLLMLMGLTLDGILG